MSCWNESKESPIRACPKFVDTFRTHCGALLRQNLCLDLSFPDVVDNRRHRWEAPESKFVWRGSPPQPPSLTANDSYGWP